MDQNSFQDYYKEVRDRDQAIADATPIPEARGASVWAIFGIAFGIVAMVLGWIGPKYGLIFGVIALALSVVAYMKKKDNYGMAAIICSGLCVVISIGFWIGYAINSAG